MAREPKPKFEDAISMHKRPARRAGEIGLFPDNQLAEEDFAQFPQNRELAVRITDPVLQKQINWCWALAGLVAAARDDLVDKDQAMEWLKEQARFVDMRMNPQTERLTTAHRSLTKLDGAGMRRLQNRFTHVVVQKVFPGIKNKELLAEIERMIAGPSHAQDQAAGNRA